MQSANQPGAALDNLRTVEFRQTLRGYHIDDVDEFLERVTVEVEALQEQLRQAGERMRQATDRITQLEHQSKPQSAAPSATAASAEESLQRTLVLAQKFVDQTQAEAETQARSLLEEAQQRARTTVSEAEERAKTIAEESERRVRDEVTRLEGLRTKLAGDVEAITRHLEIERARLRGALGEMLHWIDENIQPGATLAVPGRDERPERDTREHSGGPGATAQAAQSSPASQGLVQVGSPNLPNGSPR